MASIRALKSYSKPLRLQLIAKAHSLTETRRQDARIGTCLLTPAENHKEVH